MIDDERIEQALQAGPPDEPVYRPRFSWTASTGLRRRGIVGRFPASAWFGGTARLTATIAVGLALLVGLTIVRGPAVPQAGSTTPADVFDRVRTAGAIRIGVPSSAPQVQIAGTSYAGFDIDVGRELARRLGLRPDITTLDPVQLGVGGWNTSLDLVVGLAPDAASQVEFSRPIVYWPALVVVRVADGATAISSLSGRSLCVVGGGRSSGWLTLTSGFRANALTISSPPPGIPTIAQATDQACLDGLASGRWDAAVVERTLASAVVARGDVRALAPSAFVYPVAAAIDRTGPPADRLLSAVSAAIDAMRADGTLSTLSRRDFGGADLSTPGGQ